MGTVSIWFQLQERKKQETSKKKKKRRDPKLLVFNLQIYRMRCLACGEYGEAEIYDSQLEKI